jgi:hypothetical protein
MRTCCTHAKELFMIYKPKREWPFKVVINFALHPHLHHLKQLLVGAQAYVP